jgi:hypothetical protein
MMLLSLQFINLALDAHRTGVGTRFDIFLLLKISNETYS